MGSLKPDIIVYFFGLGHNISDMLSGILDLLPLDSYVECPVSYYLNIEFIVGIYTQFVLYLMQCNIHNNYIFCARVRSELYIIIYRNIKSNPIGKRTIHR